MQQKKRRRPLKIRLAAGRKLERGAAGTAAVLLSPAGAVQLNATAAAILELCDGTRTREEIVARIVAMKNDNLADDVREFLDAARRRGWITEQ